MYKKKPKKFKRILVAFFATACVFSSMSAINAGAVTHSLTYTNISSSKVSVILSASSNTTLVISPLRCTRKNGYNYSYVTDTNSTGNGTSIYAGVTPGSGWTLVASDTGDYTRYSYGSSGYLYSYYWS